VKRLEDVAVCDQGLSIFADWLCACPHCHARRDADECRSLFDTDNTRAGDTIRWFYYGGGMPWVGQGRRIGRAVKFTMPYSKSNMHIVLYSDGSTESVKVPA